MGIQCDLPGYPLTSTPHQSDEEEDSNVDVMDTAAFDSDDDSLTVDGDWDDVAEDEEGTECSIQENEDDVM